MKYALVCGKRTEASKGARGVCPSCRSDLVARCGNYRVNHWAHKGTRNCDTWWENETEWHRSWKNNFPPRHFNVVILGSENRFLSCFLQLTSASHPPTFLPSYVLTIEQYREKGQSGTNTRKSRFCHKNLKLRNFSTYGKTTDGFINYAIGRDISWLAPLSQCRRGPPAISSGCSFALLHSLHQRSRVVKHGCRRVL